MKSMVLSRLFCVLWCCCFRWWHIFIFLSRILSWNPRKRQQHRKHHKSQTTIENNANYAVSHGFKRRITHLLCTFSHRELPETHYVPDLTLETVQIRQCQTTIQKNCHCNHSKSHYSSIMTSRQTEKQHKRVTFSSISIVEFPYEIGITPCSSGVPIGASLEAQHQTTFQLDFFEKYRPVRRSKSDLHISANDRKAL
jgi:hypothetical protein